MHKPLLFVLAVGLLSQSPSKAAQGQETPPATQEKKASPTQKTLKSIFEKDSTLLADNVKLNNKKRKQDLNKAIEASILAELEREDLDYPAIDLYGEQSWHRDAVNPFVGPLHANIPDTFNIDVTQFVCPLDTEHIRITSHYGYRRRFRRMHYGIDLKLQTGDTVRAAFDGKVRMVKYERRGYGHYVVLRHPNGLETVYGHLSRALVTNDQIVHAGDPIALGGNTGRSTGSHLHFETRFMGIPINPHSIINFETGVPRQEAYVFHRMGDRRTYASGVRKSSGHKNNIIVHRVRKGDTLSEIASKYGTSVKRICQLNRISRRSNLKVGKVLRISS